MYVCGRYSVNVLPTPGSLARRISPPSRRASSRLIERPSPVPPYLRLVVPSACWNASKMMRCLSCAMPMPVSVTENAIDVFARLSTGWPALQPAVARFMRSFTEPRSVNFSAFESRFFSTCCSRLASVWMRLRETSGSTSMVNSRPLPSATWRNVREQ